MGDLPINREQPGSDKALVAENIPKHKQRAIFIQIVREWLIEVIGNRLGINFKRDIFIKIYEHISNSLGKNH